jgi:hypothetical protein
MDMLVDVKSVKPKCSIVGCNNVARNMGHGRFDQLCHSHHNKKYHMPTGGTQRLRRSLNRNLCSNCKWVGPCDLHRLTPGQTGGKYKKGNIVIICPNCHRLLHLGKIKL